MKSIHETVDVIIAGGVTAGHVAAIQAARAGAKTSVIEAGSMLRMLRFLRSSIPGCERAVLKTMYGHGAGHGRRCCAIGEKGYPVARSRRQ